MALCLAEVSPVVAWELRAGGDVRLYGFVRLEEEGPDRRDTELGIFRMKLDGREGRAVAVELHGVLALLSPPSSGATTIATGLTRRLLELEVTLADGEDVTAVAELDRLNVAWRERAFRLVIGRQAITWGVSVFWPALDLFAPFAPERVDREYKAGLDALRLTVPIGLLSELEVVAAGQGTSLREDGSVGAWLRLHLGPADVGGMAGWFHQDVVVGAFVTGDVRGTGVRGEVAFTDSGDPADARLGRARFWRASVGLDRQLTPTLTLTAEAAWNGFGATDVDRYPGILAADRVRRGEVQALGRHSVGVSLGWQAHPLVVVTGGVLANLDDGSVLVLPRLDWSLADNLALVAGGIAGIGPGLRADGTPGSEYGPVPAAVYVALKAYF